MVGYNEPENKSGCGISVAGIHIGAYHHHTILAGVDNGDCLVLVNENYVRKLSGG